MIFEFNFTDPDSISNFVRLLSELTVSGSSAFVQIMYLPQRTKYWPGPRPKCGRRKKGRKMRTRREWDRNGGAGLQGQLMSFLMLPTIFK